MAESLQDFKAELFRVLAHPTRIRILETLRAAGSLTVTEIHQRIGVEPSNASQHLSALRNQGLVSARREGTSAFYSLAEPGLEELLDAARRVFERQTEARAALLVGEGGESAAPGPAAPRRNRPTTG